MLPQELLPSEQRAMDVYRYVNISNNPDTHAIEMGEIRGRLGLSHDEILKEYKGILDRATKHGDDAQDQVDRVRAEGCGSDDIGGN